MHHLIFAANQRVERNARSAQWSSVVDMALVMTFAYLTCQFIKAGGYSG